MSKTDMETHVKHEKMIADVAGMADRSDKTSWNRKLKNIQKLIDQVSELEEKMSKIREQRQPLLDEIANYRAEMVETCIHPAEHLVIHEGAVKCKFCERTIRMLDSNNG